MSKERKWGTVMRRGRERENLNLREIRNGKRERMRNNKCDKTLAMNLLY